MNKKIFQIGICLIVSLLITIVFVLTNLYAYLIVTIPLVIIVGSWFFIEFKGMNSTPEKSYDTKLNKLIRIYNPILVNTNKFPKLNNKSILTVSNFDDLVDAQSETRTPIYYIKDIDCTAFFLINGDVFLVYYLKVNDNDISELEMKLKEMELRSSLNLEALSDFDKTVIIQTNNKAYKVSPMK